MQREQKTLEFILKNVFNGKYANTYNISKNISFEEFRNKVPLVSYDDIKNYIKRAYEGEENVFTKEPILLWGMTSGTTGEPKLIPHTKTSLSVYKKAINRFFFKELLNYPSLIKGKILSLVGKYCNYKSPAGLVVGSISGIMASNIPQLFKNKIIYDPKILDKMNDNERFSYIAEGAVNENINSIASSSATYLFGFLENVRKLTDKNFKELWPSLKVVSFPTGGHYRRQLREVKEALPFVDILDTGFGSTEGYFFNSIIGDRPKGFANSDLYFIELLDIGEENKFASTKMINEVNIGKEYELVISSINGLLRYRMGDIVEVVDIRGKKGLEFISKKYPEISFFGERFTEPQLNDALSKTAKELGLDIKDYWFIPPTDNFRNYFLIIPQNLIKEESIFSNLLEKKLQETNINYQNIRTMTSTINPIRVIVSSDDFLNSLKYYSYFAGQGREKHVYFPKSEGFYKNFKNQSI